MTDFIDRMVDNESLILNARIANRVKYRGVSATNCVECDEPIPEGRRVALPGVKKCVECAE